MLGELSAFGASLTWAWGTTVYSKLAHKYPAVTVNLGRALIGFPLFVIAGFFETHGGSWPVVSPSQYAWFAVSVICSTAVGDWVFLMATTEIGPSLALAIASFYPVYSAFAGVLIKGEILSGIQYLGLLVAVSGIIYVVLLGRKNGDVRNLKRGLLLGILTSFFWFLNTFAVATAGRGLPSGVANMIRLGMAIVFCTFLGGIVFRVRRLTLEQSDLKKYSWVFAIEAFFGSFFYVYGLSHASLAVGSVLTALAPAISVPLAWMSGSERVSYRKLIGIVVVVAGLSLLVIG